MKKRDCHCCGGTGQEIDHESLGAELRVLRKSTGLSLCEIARRMDISAPYLSDLERGRRNWSTNMSTRYKAALRVKV